MTEPTPDPRPGQAPPPLGDVLEFMRLLWAVDHGLQSISKRMQGQFGVTGPQRLALRIVGQIPSISAGDLAAILHVHPSTLTGVLKRLVDRRHVERKVDPADGRRVQLFLTPSGQRLSGARGGTIESAVQRVLARFPPERSAIVRDLLVNLAQELGPMPVRVPRA